MSPEEFEEIIFSSKSAYMRKAFAGLDEKTRKSLSTSAQSAYSSISRNKPAKAASERVKNFVKNRKGESWDFWNSSVNQRASLALYAVAPLSGVKKQNLFIHGAEQQDIMFGILEDRAPSWLGDWVAWKLEQEWHNLQFPRVYGWIKKGLMEKPDTPEYYTFYVTSLDVFLNKDGRYGVKPADYVSLSARLRKDLVLLADALSVFKVENRALSTDSWRTDHAHPKYESWADALISLCETGHIQRDALLDASLDGLSEDLKNNQLSGNHKFHSRLEPTVDERSAREQSYRELLTHPTGHVVKFALVQLSALDKAGRANRTQLLSELPVVLQSPGKGNAKTALRLAAGIAKSDVSLRDAVLTSIIPTLDHEDSGLQEAALKIISQYKDALSDDHKNEIERATHFLAASLKPQALDILGQESVAEETIIAPADVQALQADVKALPEAVQEAYGLKGLAGDLPFRPTLISADLRKMQVLHLAEPLTPIETHDDLYTAIARALEVVDNASEVELIIDGISRLGRNTSPEFAQRLDPLIKRINGGGTGTSRGLTGTWNALGYAAIDLVQAWTTGKLNKRNFSNRYYPHFRAAEPMIVHMQAMAQRIISGKTQLRMCTPTHQNGWIDPLIWVERAKLLSASSQKSDIPDICYSMLRLAPDNRAKAATYVDALPQPWKAVGRFLFGLDDRPNVSVKTHPNIWISAARARDPLADWSEVLSELRLLESAPDGLRPAAYIWGNVTTETTPTWSRVPIKTTVFTIKANPAENAKNLAETKGSAKTSFLTRMKPKTTLSGHAIPTAALAMNFKANRWGGGGAGWLFEWMTLFWPQNARSLYARATYAFDLDENASSWSTGHGYLNALFQANRAWGETGHLLIARGLASKNADIRGYIIDALIEGVENGQFDPPLLASIFQKMIEGGGVKLGRIAEGLTRVSEVSPLHAALIGTTLSDFLPNLDRKTHALSTLMELWLESAAASGQAVEGTALNWLSDFKGTSKSAKAAKKILGLTYNEALDASVRAQALESRLRLVP